MEQAAFLISANLGYALSINLFLEDNKLAAGGFSGLAIALNHFFYVPVGPLPNTVDPAFALGLDCKGQIFHGFHAYILGIILCFYRCIDYFTLPYRQYIDSGYIGWCALRHLRCTPP
jgi:uncharacterized membrane-anchored protein YitT (DUF2179 family)